MTKKYISSLEEFKQFATITYPCILALNNHNISAKCVVHTDNSAVVEEISAWIVGTDLVRFTGVVVDGGEYTVFVETICQVDHELAVNKVNACAKTIVLLLDTFFDFDFEVAIGTYKSQLGLDVIPELAAVISDSMEAGGGEAYFSDDGLVVLVTKPQN